MKAKLPYRCNVYEIVSSTDTAGGQQPSSLTLVTSRRCDYDINNGNESYLASQNASNYDASLKLRYTNEIANENIIIVDNIKYEINSVIHNSEKTETYITLIKTNNNFMETIYP